MRLSAAAHELHKTFHTKSQKTGPAFLQGPHDIYE